MIILIHSSKTMKTPPKSKLKSEVPILINDAVKIDSYLKKLNAKDIKKTMSLSDELALKTIDLINEWNADIKLQRPAIDSFIGDIYSGLQVKEMSEKDRQYANKHLRILSGLYGILRPLDGIYPYRLEMGYKIKIGTNNNLYGYWADKIAKTLPENELVINLAAVEYNRVVTKFHKGRIIAPKFMTLDKKTRDPKFIVVHAKIARGAFASWIIKNQIKKTEDLKHFNDLGYRYITKLSTDETPFFICDNFGGLGLSVRLT